jgi:hypothetical protein
MTDPRRNATVLIATLGERDPDGRQRRTTAGAPPEPLDPNDPIAQPTGPLLCARTYRPGAVVLLATEGVRVPAELTRGRIAAELGVEPSLRWLAGDPANFDDMQDAVERELRNVRRELPNEVSVVVCPSSGTPQMGQALTIVTMFLFPTGKIVQALDPRYVPADAPRLRMLDPRATRVRFDLEQAAQALLAGHWAVAAEIFFAVRSVESRVVSEYAPVITAAWRLAKGMELAEELDFAAAARAFRPERDTGFRAELDGLKQWYERLHRGQHGNTDYPRELAAMAARQRKLNALSRATVTAAMAWETTLTVALHTRCRLDPDYVRQADLSRLSPELRQRVREEGGRRRLEGARVRRQALEELDAEAGACLGEQDAALERLAKMRNRLVHCGSLAGGDPGAIISAALDALDKLFARFSWGSWRDTPTAPGQLRALAEQIAGAWLPEGGG